MPDSNSTENSFISKLTLIVEENISDESFGVAELADRIGMSRSNLLRKVKSISNLSVSQFMRQIRLEKAMELLKDSELTVSEVSYEVGFGSASYFIKCFHEHYGFSPGEANNQKQVSIEDEKTKDVEPLVEKKTKLKPIYFISVILTVIVVAGLFIVKTLNNNKQTIEKSIAVLPFINDSNDSINVHIINGLRESILNNLQKIGDLKVISRTSVERYRNTNKSIPEIAKELNVSYFIEGSGQKNNDEILLNIQLIAAKDDKHLWAEQYKRKVTDIFKLQQEVARKIANEIEVIITPEVSEQIEKIPTQSLTAYEFYLKGMELFYLQTEKGYREGIKYFEKALIEDDKFALAYAQLAINYYFLDLFAAEKKYTYLININADKALLYDPKLPQSLIAKASYYNNIGEYEMALPHLEKAYEYHPNSVLVINLLSNFYTNFIPNSEKYLYYALKGISLDIGSHDSIATSYTYLHMSNAFIQTGFVNEALEYVNKSLAYYPHNIYSLYVKPYILFAKSGDLNKTAELLVEVFQRDTTRLDLMQEIGKVYYQAGKVEEAYKYYRKFATIRENQKLELFTHENLKIASVFFDMGFEKEAKKYLEDYLAFAKNDKSIYKHAMLAGYYSYTNNVEKAIEHLKLFAHQENYHYWIVMFFDIDPAMKNLKNNAEAIRVFDQIKVKFWRKHEQLKIDLVDENLLVVTKQ